MTLKSTIPALALAIVMALTSSQALAQTAPKEDPTLSKHWDAHSKTMGTLQDQLWSKNMEYDALVDNPNTKPADIKALVNDMSKLQSQMRTERNNYRDKMGAAGYGSRSGNGRWHDSYRGDGYGPNHRGGGWHDSYRGDDYRYSHRGYDGCNGGGRHNGRGGHHGY